MIPEINRTICTECGRCVEVCPPLAIELVDEKACIDETLCEECGFCAAVCPVDAIRILFPLSPQSGPSPWS